MKLQSRLALSVALAAAIAILAMATAAWVLGNNQQRSDVDTSLVRVVSEPRRFVNLEAFNASGELRGVRRGADADLAVIQAANGRLFTRLRLVINDRVVLDDGLPAVETPQVGDGAQLKTVEIDGERFRMAWAPLPSGRLSGTIQVARNIEDLEAGLGRLRRQILAAGLIGVALAALLGALVARRLAAPITKVSNAAKELAQNNALPDRIEVTRSDEVGDLATSFNQMLGALELSREQQRRLVGDASHELRTPLTSLRLKIDLLDSTPELPEVKRQELLSASALEVERLGELVTELVDLATDPTGVEEQSTAQSIPALVGEMCEEARMRSGRSIELAVASNGADYPVRVRMVRRAVSNLLDNAVKYSEQPSSIEVTVDGPRIEVRDKGEGIPEADLEFVFDRFYRSSTARTRPGNGIGLAIVQRVAELHGGEVWARNANGPPGAVVGFSIAPESD